MITTAVALISTLGWPGGQPPTAGQIISGMLARYHSLSTLTGTIQYTLTAKASTGVVSEETDTTLQYQTPGKLYLRQSRTGQRAKVWIISSDGRHFSYNYPEGQGQHGVSNRLVEPLTAKTGTIAEIYAASSLSIGDRSAPLGIAISWNDELKRIVAEWPTHTLAGEIDTPSGKAWKITGGFKDNPDGAVVGDYVLIVNKHGDLIQYETHQKTMPPVAEGQSGTGNSQVDANNLVTLTRTWNVRLQPNGTPDPALFRVVLDK